MGLDGLRMNVSWPQEVTEEGFSASRRFEGFTLEEKEASWDNKYIPNYYEGLFR